MLKGRHWDRSREADEEAVESLRASLWWFCKRDGGKGRGLVMFQRRLVVSMVTVRGFSVLFYLPLFPL